MHQSMISAFSPSSRLPFSCQSSGSSSSSSSSSNTSNVSLSNNDPNSLTTNALQLRMKSLAEKADAYLRSRGYEVNQRNGQRISVKADQESEENAAKEHWQNEVFVGKIPRELFEDHLLPFMEQAGPVKQIRLMMDFSGTNRGFGFVMYLRSADAAYACSLLTGHLLTPDAEFPIGVKPSFDNKILYFGNLPLKLTRERLLKELNRVLDGVVDVQLCESSNRPQNNTNKPANKKSRYAYVCFKTHDHATQARRILLPGIVRVFDRQISVDWAKPEAPAMNQSDILNSRRLRSNSSIINTNNRLTSLAIAPPTESILAPITPDIPSIDFSNPIESSLFYDPIQTWEDIFSPSESILGEKAKEILELTMPDHSRLMTVCNIKTDSIDLSKIKHIFELNGQLKIVKIISSGVESITIEYATSNQAAFMVEAIILMPECFAKLAVRNQLLSAFHGTMADVNANYQLPLAYYNKQPLISQ